MKEINLGQTDCSKEDGHCGPLRSPKDLVYLCFARDLLPQPSSRPLSNNSIPIRSTCDLERRPIPSTISKWRAVVVNISVQLLFESLHQDLSFDKVLAAISTFLVHLHIWAVAIQFATLLQTKQTLLCAKLCCMFLILAASFISNARLACGPLSRWGGCDLAEAPLPS